MRNRRKPSLDKNQAGIVSESFAHGYSVYDGASVGGGASDLIIADKKKTTILFEVKNGAIESCFYLGQIEFLARWKGHAAIAKTFTDVQNAMNDPEKYCLSDAIKEKLLAFVHREKIRVSVNNPKADLSRHKVTSVRLEKLIGNNL